MIKKPTDFMIKKPTDFMIKKPTNITETKKQKTDPQMKININTDQLTRELAKVQGIVSGKSTLPITQNVLFEAHADGRLSIHATDLDISLNSVSTCEVEKAGKVTVKAKDFYNIVKSLRADVVSLTVKKGHNLHLKAGTVKAMIVGQDPDDFPSLSSTDSLAFISFDTQKFMRLIDRTNFSISTDQGRPNLTGAQIIYEDEKLQMLSTDGHRLSIASYQLPLSDVPEELKNGIIISRKGFLELKRNIELAEEHIKIAIDGTKFVTQQNNTEIFIRVIEGVFPDFSKVLPAEDLERRASVSRAELADRVKFVALFASKTTRNIRIEFDSKKCTISANDNDKGECKEEISIDFSSSKIIAGFNYTYILDVLKVISGKKVLMQIIDENNPTIIRDPNLPDDEDAIFVVMPMRL